MRYLKYIFFLAFLTASTAYADSSKAYFQLGEWEIGENIKVILDDKSTFHSVAEVVKKKQYRANVNTIFSDNIPAEFYFRNKKLSRVELILYEGHDYEKANAAAKLIISTFEKNFDGALMEGLTTSEGLKPEIFDVVVGQLLEKSKSAISEINTDKKENEAYFNLFIGFSTEYLSKGNFLYGKFSYFGDKEIYNVTIYEDKKFNGDHVAPAMIHIGSKKNANN